MTYRQIMDFLALLAVNISVCVALLASYLLFFASVAFIQRKIQRHRYVQRIDEYKKYGLDPYKVPESLRDLIPLAKKWQAQNAEERQQLQRAATNADKLELSRQIIGHEDTILMWLSSFNGHPATREALAYESMLRSFQEMQLIVDDRYFPDNETLQVDFVHQSPGRNWLPHAERFRPRFLKNLPTWASMVIGIPVFSGSFIICGKVWSFLFLQSSSEIGLSVVNFLSAFVTGVTLILLDRLYGLRQA